MSQIEKPAYGAPCNGCGYCCRDGLCALATMMQPRWQAPCPALVKASDGRSMCGLIAAPRRFAPHRCSKHGVGAVKLAAALLIGAGHGCDAAKEGEAVDEAGRARMRDACMSIPADAVEAARRIWGVRT